ncbi:hypothetical protein BDK51DRAFT_3077, partial [Blyttiomyces helicus]
CGRRMMLAALVLSAKFLHDRPMANRGWAALAGVPLKDLNVYEHRMLRLLDYQL